MPVVRSFESAPIVDAGHSCRGGVRSSPFEIVFGFVERQSLGAWRTSALPEQQLPVILLDRVPSRRRDVVARVVALKS